VPAVGGAVSPALQGMPNKKVRRTKAEIRFLKEAIYRTCEELGPITDRGLFYALLSRLNGFAKTEENYQNVVVRLCGVMREVGELPWAWILDHTRWQRKPRSYCSITEALDETRRTYRRDLWANQAAYVELWCEKNALAALLYQITEEYDVPLMVSVGFSSKGFLHSTAEAIKAVGKPAFIYQVGDLDPSGKVIMQSMERSIRRYALDAPITFERLALTEEQVRRYKLPTRPTKRKGNSHAKNWKGDSVEVDALDPVVLQGIVRRAIEQHINPRQLEVVQKSEASERNLLEWVTQVAKKKASN
jgi:hypothetical protein